MKSNIILSTAMVFLLLVGLSNCKQKEVKLQEHILSEMFDKPANIDSLLIQTKTVIEAGLQQKIDTLVICQ